MNQLPKEPSPSDLKLWSEQSEMCRKCIAKYKQLYDEGMSTAIFPPLCYGDLRYIYGDISTLSDEDAVAAATMNPVAWAACNFTDPENPTKPFELRSYQADMVSCTAQCRVFSCGRRTGKTWANAVKIYHECCTNPGLKVLFVAAYEPQVEVFFDAIDTLSRGYTGGESPIARRRLDPQQVTFKNSSNIIGFCAGMNSGSVDKICGQDAHIIIIDEADLIEMETANKEDDGGQRDVIGRIMAIMISKPHVMMRMASTPRCHGSRFDQACKDADRGWRLFHVTAMQSPSWNDRTAKILRNEMTDLQWSQDVLAVLTRQEGGVIPAEKIDASCIDYDLATQVRQNDWLYGIGVDWNAFPIGCHMIAVGFNKTTAKFRMVDYKISNKETLTQTTAIFDICEFFQKWRADTLWCDAGFGTVQVEALIQFAVQHPHLQMMNKIKSCSMQEPIEIVDPFSRQPIKKQLKPLMADICTRRFESLLVELPTAGRTEKRGLVTQLKRFRVAHYTPSGVPVYSQGNDHGVISLFLAISSLVLTFSDLKGIRLPASETFVTIQKPDAKPFEIPHRTTDINMASFHRGVGRSGTPRQRPTFGNIRQMMGTGIGRSI